MYNYSDRRHLHFFPTRRSSDLATRRSGSSPRNEARDLSRRPFCRCSACGSPLSSTTATPHPPEKDRKSTRLNSSHLVISYAVFCLKKKKTTITTRPADGANNPE